MHKDLLFDRIYKIYLKNPSMQATALWKLKTFLYSDETFIKKINGSLYVLHNDSAWTIFPFDKEVLYEDVKNITSAVLHDKQLSVSLKKKRKNMRPFFKLTHRLNKLIHFELPEGYEFRKVKWNQNKTAAKFISECYPDMTLKPSTVAHWKLHPTYDKNLWWWVIEKSSNKPVALGIGERDSEINEGTLEWIQVHPGYRRNKIGSLLVQKLLFELDKECDFVTVSGEITETDTAELFYTSNGFDHKETWWIIDSSLI